MEKKKTYLTYFAGLLLFGSNGVIASFIALSSHRIVLLRSVLGCMLMLVLFFTTGQRFSLRNHKKDLLYVAVSGVAMAVDWLFLFEAYAQIGVSLGMLINYCGPAIVIAASPFILGEKIYRAKVIALIAALLGAFLISGQAAVSGLRLTGLLCAVMSAFSYAVMVLSNKKAFGISGFENVTLQILFTAITVFLFSLLRRDIPFAISGEDILPVLWLGLINTGLGCYFYFSSIGKLPAQTVAVCGYIEPLSAVLFSSVILRERMLPLQVLGAILIIGGALYGELKNPDKT